VFPLRDLNPVYRAPVVVYGLVAVNALVWFWEFALLFLAGPEAQQAFVDRWGVIPRELWTLDAGELLTAVTSMFLHGDWLHVLGNLWFLWVFGDNVEDRLGRVWFVIFYFACGLAAVATQTFVDPASSVPMVGASGAIAGVLAAYVVLYPTARVLTFLPIFFLAEVPAFLFVFVWFGIQLLNGYFALGSVGENLGGTAFFAHIGGFVAGLVLVLPFRKRAFPRPDVVWRRGVPPTRWNRDRDPWREDYR
jgi:membrane associated rhomboid family serine protease